MRRVLLASCCVLAALLVLVATPVGAAAAPTPDAPPTTDPDREPEPEPPTPPDDPGAQGDAPTPPPLEPDEIADPPRGRAGADRGNSHEVIVGSIERVEGRLAEDRAQLDAVRERIEDLRGMLTFLEQLDRDLTTMRERTRAARARAEQRRLRRAVGAYVRGGPPRLEPGLGPGPSRELEEAELLATVLHADDALIARLIAREMDLTRRLEEVADERRDASMQLALARRTALDLEAAVASGEYAAEVFAAGGEIAITGFVFPVGDPYEFIDSWGFPRAGGRRHEGADIFARRGTPLFAVEDGVLARVGDDRLGGIKLWLVGESGTHYYYAHLERYAPGVRDGAPVAAGDVVGYVGDTGDARGTPPHLHFEVHPDGGEPVNPYPLLKVVDELDAARSASD